jgi:hypothetical protein
MNCRKSVLLGVLLLFVLSSFTHLTLAQETTGSLKGKVVFKEDNSALAGISITIDSPNLMGTKTVMTDERGDYRFPSLPPGVYKVKAEAPGLKTVIREEIIISVGKAITLDFVMETATVTGTIVITGESPMVDLEKSGLSLNVKSETLQTLPMPRDYLQVIQLAPGVNTTADNPSVHGESDWNNQYLMDGVDTTDPVSGGSGTSFNFDVIEEMEFKTGGFEAEYGQVMGAVINVVTKSGGNKFGGAINVNLMDPSLTGNNLPEEEREAYPVKKSLRDYSFTFGGPIKKDKVWFFTSFQYSRSISQRGDVDYKSTNEAFRWMGKITSQLNPSHSIVLFGWGDPYNGYGSMLDPYWGEETNPRSFGGAKINAAGIWSWTISKNAFLQTKVTRFYKSANLEPTEDDSIPHYYDIFTQMRWGNYTFHNLTDQARYQGESDFTYFIDDFVGSHQIKTGVEYLYSFERNQLWEVADGWGLFLLNNGRPFMAQYKPGKEDCKARSNRFSLYAQDTWKLGERLVLNPGIRFDYTVGKNDVLQIIHDYKTFSPRFGFVYRLTKDEKTTLKGNYSKYYENPFLFFPDIFSKGKTPLYLYMYDPFTSQYDILLQTLSAETYQFLNELRCPYLNEFMLGIERELLPNFSVSLTGIYRKTKDIIEDIETNLLYEDPNNPYTPTGSKDGTGLTIFSVGNPDQAYRQYKGLEITFEKRLANNWMFLGSYTLSETKGTVATSFTGFLDSPGETVNRDGYLSTDRRHILKLAGSYNFPYGIHLGFQYRLLSGFPYTKLLMNPFYGYYGIYETPLGGKDPVTGKIRRYPTLHSFDLRIEKTFKVWNGHFGVYGDIYNIFNAATPTSYYTFDNPQYEHVSTRTSPINARINIRYSF